MQLLRRFEMWDELIEDCKSGYIEMTRLPAEQGKVHVSLGIAYYCRNEIQNGDQELAALRQLGDEQRAQRQAAFDEANQRPQIERATALGAVNTRFGRPLASLDSQIAQLESYRAILTGFYLSRGRLLIYLGLLAVGETALLWFLRRRMFRAMLSGVGAAAVAGWLFFAISRSSTSLPTPQMSTLRLSRENSSTWAISSKPSGRPANSRASVPAR